MVLCMTTLYTGTDRALLWWDLSFAQDGAPVLRQGGELEVGKMPSFMAFSKNRRLVVAVAEQDDQVCSLVVDQTGGLTLKSSQTCAGGPAYVSLTEDERWVLTASYGSGELHVYPLDENGTLGAKSSTVHSGTYSHCAVKDPETHAVYVPSKGTDSLYLAKLDAGTGALSTLGCLSTPSGTGPRHLVLSPDGKRAYLANENDCTLMAFHRKIQDQTPRLTALSRLFALPRPQLPTDSGADVHVSSDGRFVYMSVRGHDSLTIFESNAQGLGILGYVSTAGQVPRNFCLLGEDLLIVANQESKNLAVFRRNAANGSLVLLGTCDVGERVFWVGNSQSY